MSWIIGDDVGLPVPVSLAVSIGEAAAVVAQDLFFRLSCLKKDNAEIATIKVSSNEIGEKIRWMSATSIRDALRLLVRAEIISVVTQGGSAGTVYSINESKAKWWAQHPKDGAELRAASKKSRPQFVSEIRSLPDEIRSLDSEIRSLPDEIRSQMADAPILQKRKEIKDENEPTKAAPTASEKEPARIVTSLPLQAQAPPISHPDPSQQPQDAIQAARRYFGAIWHDITDKPAKDWADRDEVAFCWESTKSQFLTQPRPPKNTLMDLVRGARAKYRHRDVVAQKTGDDTAALTGPLTRPWHQGIPIEVAKVPSSDKNGTVIPKHIGIGFNFDDIKRHQNGEWFIDQGTDAFGVPRWEWSKEKPHKISVADVEDFMKKFSVSKEKAQQMLGVGVL